jgi:hypothetical protein
MSEDFLAKITPEGKARARAKLDAARAYWTPERRAAFDARFGGHRVRPLDESRAYPEDMAERESDAPVTTEELLAAVGITVTEEGKARARAKLEAAEARWTPEKWDALRRQVGLDEHAA